MELMIAMSVLLFGLLAISGLLGTAVITAVHAKEQSVANQLAREAIESVYTARLMGTLDFNSIRNVSGGGIFLDGYQPINQAGADGLANTADDQSAGPLTYTDPGKDGIYNTADDMTVKFENFERELLITDVNAALRKITVNVRYKLNSQTTVLTMTTILSNLN